METQTEAMDQVFAKMEITQAILTEGYTYGDFVGIGPAEIEAGYMQAHQWINAGQTAKAETMLTTLCSLDPYQSRLWMALGVCRQIERKYDDALNAYGLALLYDVENVHIPLHVAECLMATKRWQDAAGAAEACLSNCDDNPEFETVRSRATTILNNATKRSRI